MTRLEELYEEENRLAKITSEAGMPLRAEIDYYRARLARLEEERSIFGTLPGLDEHTAHTRSMIEHCNGLLNKGVR